MEIIGVIPILHWPDSQPAARGDQHVDGQGSTPR